MIVLQPGAAPGDQKMDSGYVPAVHEQTMKDRLVVVWQQPLDGLTC